MYFEIAQAISTVAKVQQFLQARNLFTKKDHKKNKFGCYTMCITAE